MGLVNNDFEVPNLTRHKEYVFLMAVEDMFGNFTVRSVDNNHLTKTIYTDGIKPSVLNNVVYRDLEMPGDTNPTFTITFSETIGRIYKNTGNIKPDLSEQSIITLEKKIDDVLTLNSPNDGDITERFEVVSYTEATPVNPQSKLVIRPKADYTQANQDFTVTVKMADQIITDSGNKVLESTLIDYIYPYNRVNHFVNAKLKDDGNGDTSSSNTISIGIDLGVMTTLNQEYYYFVVNSTFPESDLTKELVNKIITNANSGNFNTIQGTSISLVGKGSISNLSGVTFNDDLVTSAIPGGPRPVFRDTDKIYLFTKDKYGNIVWATDKDDLSLKYMTIKPTNWVKPTTP
jgi:hypothetical protein